MVSKPRMDELEGSLARSDKFRNLFLRQVLTISTL